jgi:hypothetical protein
MDDAITPTLSTPEWNAVRVALADASRGCAARSEPGRLARFVRWLTGIEPPRPLADPRLEALRTVVCESRTRRAALDDLTHRLATLGFNRRQAAAIALLAA